MNKEIYDVFLKERKQIGGGSRSIVHSWNNYAYKCYGDDYLQEWIDREYIIQKQIIKTELNVVKFYRTSFPNTMKMDLIMGKTISDLLFSDDEKKIFNLFMEEFDKIHGIKNLDLEDLSDFLKSQVKKANVTSAQRQRALRYIDTIDNKADEEIVLCHMDYHFLNTMYDNEKVYILDWFDARNGRKIYDFARTYVIIYQYATGYKSKYLKRVLNKYGYDKEIFKQAVYVNAVNRLQNYENKKMRQLLKLIENNKW